MINLALVPALGKVQRTPIGQQNPLQSALV